MAFPQTPLGQRVELLIGGAWTDITSDVRGQGDILITRGAPDEKRRVSASRCGLAINSRTGKYSNRNPLSPYFGLLGRNTQLRVVIPDIPAGADSGVNSTDLVAPSVKTHVADSLLLCVWMAGGDAAATFNITVPGGMTAGTEVDETFSTTRSGRQTVASGDTGTRTATSSGSPLRWSGGSVALPGTVSVQEVLQDAALAADVTLTTGAGTQAGWWMVAFQAWDIGIQPGSAPSGGDWYELGGSGDGRMQMWIKRVAVGGAQAVTFDSGALAVDNHAHLFVVSDMDLYVFPAAIATRFWGEVPSWPQRWDTTGTDVWVPIEAAGIMRRLGQGATPLKSPMYREITSVVNDPYRVAYWPGEDGGSTTTQVASGHSGGTPMAARGAVTFAADTSFPGSEPLLTLAAGASLTGTVGPHTATGTIAYRGAFVFPQAGLTNGTRVLQIEQSGGGTITRWVIIYGTGGALTLQGRDSSDAVVQDSGPIGFAVDGRRLLLGMQVAQNGANIDWGMFTRHIDAAGEVVEGGTDASFTTATVGMARQLTVAPTGGLAGVATGHHAIGTSLSLAITLQNALIGYAGETDVERIQRLCDEEDVSVSIVGDATVSAKVGAQRVETLLNLLFDAADAGQGILYEPRNAFGLAYRTQAGLYNQTGLELSYPGSHLSEVPEPVDDDQALRNYIIAARFDGSSALAVQTNGPLSTQDPPDGVGRYDETVTVNVQTDQQLPNVAGWRLHVGTWDEARFPLVAVNLARSVFITDWALTAAALAVDIGGMLSIADPPSWLPPDTISLLAQGTVETITNRRESREWTLRWNASPAGPYDVPVYDVDRYACTGCVLYEDITSGATSIRVKPGDRRWSTAGADFTPNLRLRFGGETIDVSAIANSAAFVAVGTAAHADNASVSPGVPAGLAEGDQMYLFAAIRSSGTGTVNTVTGSTWTLIDSFGNCAVFRRTATSSESAPTVTFSGGAAGDTCSAQICAFRGVSTDVVASPTAQLNGSAQDIAFGGITVEDDCAVVVLLGWKQDDWTSVAPPTGFTEIAEAASTLGNDQGLYWAYQIQSDRTSIQAGTIVVTGGAAAISRAKLLAVQGLQTLTVAARSVNGVVKAQTAGTEVRLAKEPVYAL